MLFRNTCTWAMALAAAGLLMAGCKSVNTRSAHAPVVQDATQISQIVALWSEAVLRQGNVPVAQGFAGKVYLFSATSNQPITSPGRFVVYAYDDTRDSTNKSESDRLKPSYKWELDESQLRDLIKRDAIGWSYSLWLPVGAPEPRPRRFTVMVTFTPHGGKTKMGESVLVDLPAVGGSSKLANTDDPSSKPAVSLAGTVMSP